MMNNDDLVRAVTDAHRHVVTEVYTDGDAGAAEMEFYMAVVALTTALSRQEARLADAVQCERDALHRLAVMDDTIRDALDVLTGYSRKRSDSEKIADSIKGLNDALRKTVRDG